MDMWAEARDALSELKPRASEMTLDQLLHLAEVKALLAIGQELSQIHHGGINPDFAQGD